ncbi:MAG: hypothetical protein WA624_12270 [Methylocella sp.]
MVVASSAYFGHSLLRTLLEFVVLITSLQIGYASGLLSRLIPSVSENAGEPRPRLRPHPEPLQPGLCDQEAQRVRGHKRVPRKATSRLVAASQPPQDPTQRDKLPSWTVSPAPPRAAAAIARNRRRMKPKTGRDLCPKAPHAKSLRVGSSLCQNGQTQNDQTKPNQARDREPVEEDAGLFPIRSKAKKADPSRE